MIEWHRNKDKRLQGLIWENQSLGDQTYYLYYAESSRNPQAKFQDSAYLSKYYRKGDSNSARRARSQLSPNAVHANCSGVGMDVSSPRFGQKFKQCGESSHRLVSCSREEVPQPIPEPTAKPANACPVSVETLVQANSPTGGEAGAAVVRATGEGIR